MGHCASRDQKDQKNLNRRIDEQIKKDQSMSLRIIKLLLLVCMHFTQPLKIYICSESICYSFRLRLNDSLLQSSLLRTFYYNTKRNLTLFNFLKYLNESNTQCCLLLFVAIWKKYATYQQSINTINPMTAVQAAS
ncbi:unnamed protein product [Onchocerca flexuosa]|uniref:Uncharacterized protein n=1 Tax=Onchocerca flexuosa TaxID=387005 RepID=A0A183H0H6_9BILA|nr:unnamed protein product [Onchocerca flexuosa]